MKSVIVEIKDGFAAALSDDGCVVKIKNQNYEVGQVLQVSNPKICFTKKIVAFAASAAALVVFSTGAWAYASPYSYVSLDVNPSIEFTLNRFDRVLDIKAVNDDGEEILSQLQLEDLNNKTIETAIIKTLEQISGSGYFDGETEDGIVIATSGKNVDKADRLAEDLKQTVEIEVAEKGDDFAVETFSVGLEQVEQARELGVTPGKLHLVENLQSSVTDPTTIDMQEWLDKPVKDIMKATKDYKNAAVSGSDAEDKAQKDEKALEGEAEKAAKEVGKDSKAEQKFEDKNDSSIFNEDSEKEESENIFGSDYKNIEKSNNGKDKASHETNKVDKNVLINTDKDNQNNQGVQDNQNNQGGQDNQYNRDSVKTDKSKDNNNDKSQKIDAWKNNKADDDNGNSNNGNSNNTNYYNGNSNNINYYNSNSNNINYYYRNSQNGSEKH